MELNKEIRDRSAAGQIATTYNYKEPLNFGECLFTLTEMLGSLRPTYKAHQEIRGPMQQYQTYQDHHYHTARHMRYKVRRHDTITHSQHIRHEGI